MSAHIKAGDMVMLVRWPHKCSMHPTEVPFGAPFIVLDTVSALQCFGCNAKFGAGAIVKPMNGYDLAYPLAWLKRIDPLRSDEDSKMEETA